MTAKVAGRNRKLSPLQERTLKNNLVEEIDIKAPLTTRKSPVEHPSLTVGFSKVKYDPKRYADIRIKVGMKQIPNEFGNSSDGGPAIVVPGNMESNLWGEISRLRKKELLEDRDRAAKEKERRILDL